jgi:heptosyltransferase-1
LRIQCGQPESIIVIRPSAIGDIVMASPMLPRLRGTFPQARIYWVVEPAMADLLSHHPDLDGVILWPKQEWSRLLRKGRFANFVRMVRSFRATLAEKRPQLVLDAQGLLRSRFLSRLSGAPLRVGFNSKEPHLGLMTHIIDRGPSTKHLGSEYHYMLDVLGIQPQRPEDVFPLGEDVIERARSLLRREGVGGPYGVLAPFTTRPQKHWPEDRWARVADVLRDDLAIEPIFLGGPRDQSSAKRIRNLCGGRVHVMCGKSNLLESFAIVSGASLTIGVDTGLTHMAMVQRRPAIALFGATCPYLFADGNQHRVLYHPLPCSPCKRSPVCDSHYPCMKAITVEEVIQTAKVLVGTDG